MNIVGVYKTLPISCVFVVLKSIPIEEKFFNNSGLYFHPPTTIINSKNINSTYQQDLLEYDLNFLLRTLTRSFFC